MENVNDIAKYLARDLMEMNGRIINRAELESKIKAALIIAAPPETKKSKEVWNLQNKLASVKAELKSKNVMYGLQVNFWKDKVKGLISKEELSEDFKKLDKILMDYGVY